MAQPRATRDSGRTTPASEFSVLFQLVRPGFAPTLASADKLVNDCNALVTERTWPANLATVFG